MLTDLEHFDPGRRKQKFSEDDVGVAKKVKLEEGNICIYIVGSNCLPLISSCYYERPGYEATFLTTQEQIKS